jgi:acyl-CoA reductase-like NAD-dependent aldehyde dehydrogenase
VEVNSAVLKADKVWRTRWRWTSPQVRAGLLLDCAKVLQENADEIARLESEKQSIVCTTPLILRSAFEIT